MTPQVVNEVATTAFRLLTPEGWVGDANEERLGVLATVRGADGHEVRVQRVLEGLMPTESLMATVAFESRMTLAGYECTEPEPANVIGAVAARLRTAVTSEGEDGRQSFVLRELFVEGLDRGMWYVTVTAPRAVFDADLAGRILDSFDILYFNEATR